MATAALAGVLQQLRTLVHAKAYEESSDRQLLELFLAQREEAAFVALLKRHGPMVLQVCRRIQGNQHDAEDVFQATFLLLARKAGSIRKPESLASWLHGVARRLALEAKAQGTRRQAHERKAAETRSTPRASVEMSQGLQETVDEALRQVPEKYRVPLVLRYLEGKTQEEVARQLGCPLGTARSRLARGRSRLKRVLQRKGVSLSAAALAAGLAESVAPAEVPPLLMYATARAGLAYAAGKAAAALVSARTAALIEGGLKAMLIAKLKIATIVLLAIGTLGVGAGAIGTRGFIGPRQPAAQTKAALPPKGDAGGAWHRGATKDPDTASGVREGQESRNEIIRGRVLGMDGKPLAGAKLLLFGRVGKPVDLGSSAADGKFTVSVPKDLKGHFLVARTDDAGLDFINLENQVPSASVELRLVKDEPIRGRITSTEGKPVAGVGVTVRHITMYRNNALEPFLAQWKSQRADSGLPDGEKYLYFNADSYPETKTDAEGRFVLAGTGADRLMFLRLSGAGIADVQLFVLNHHGFDRPSPSIAASGRMPPPAQDTRPDPLVYGPDLSVVAESEKLIRGVVRAADTGKPRAGVEVWLARNADSLLWLGLSAKTDAQGRYEIHGARKAKTYAVSIMRDAASGYLAGEAVAPDTPGYESVTADIRLFKGVVVTGRVIDKTTGQPVPGFGMAGVLSDNRFAKEYPEASFSEWNRADSTDDGTFGIVTIPGRVLLMGGPDSRRLPGGELEAMKYKPVVPDSRYPQYFTNRLGPGFYALGGGIEILQGNYCKVLDIKPGAARVHEDMILEQADAIPVKIQDAEGRPLTGTWVTGISPVEWMYPLRIEKESCFAYHVTAGTPRLMVFCEQDRNLVGTLKLTGDEKQPVVVKLGPAGTVTGRLLAEGGRPVPGFVIKAFYRTRVASEIFRHIDSAKPPVVTDAEGKFRIDGLIPGVEFELDHYRSGRTSAGLNVLTEKLTVKPGETRTLGDLRARLEE